MAKRTPMRNPQSEEVTLSSAIHDVWCKVMLEGQSVKCPCCQRVMQVYKRVLNTGMAYSLVWLYHKSGDQYPWIDVPAAAPVEVIKDRQFDKLEKWAFVKRKIRQGKRGKIAGLWRITQQGKAFAENRLRAPLHAYIYLGEVLHFEEVEIDIVEALRPRYDYEKLMHDASWVV